MLKRVHYVSRWARDLSSDELDALVADAAARNRELGLTGILLTSGRLFMQVLEGPVEAVDHVLGRIVADPRHTDVLVLGEEMDGARVFPDWAMERVALEDADERLEPLRALLEAISAQRAIIGRLAGVLERAAWRELVGR